MPTIVSFGAVITVDGTSTTGIHSFDRAPGPAAAKLRFGNVTGLTGTLSVSEDGTTYFNVPSVTSGGVFYAAGATITVVDGMSLYAAFSGWKYVKFTRTAGDGPYRVCEMEDLDEFVAAMLALLAAGITISGTVTATVTNGGVLPTIAPRITVTPTLDTGAYGANDVWFDTTAVSNAARANDQPLIINGIQLVDRADQAAADGVLYILDANVSVGTINNAPSISDDNAANIIARIPFLSTDWEDLGGVKILTIDPAKLPKMLFPASGTRTIYIAGRTAGTGTYAADSLRVILQIQDAIARS